MRCKILITVTLKHQTYQIGTTSECLLDMMHACKHSSNLLVNNIPYSQKYWQELNLAVWSQTDITKILADFNLAVRYGIAIRTYAQKKFGGF